MNSKSQLRTFSIGFIFGVLALGLCFLVIPPPNHLLPINKTSGEPISSQPKLIDENKSGHENLVNINDATLSELVSLPGLGDVKAAKIIEFREKYGPFEEISELTYVPGIGINLFNSIQDLVIINND